MGWGDQIGEYRAGEYDALDIPAGTIMTRRPPSGTAGLFLRGFYLRGLLAMLLLVASVFLLTLIVAFIGALVTHVNKTVISTILVSGLVLMPLLLPYAFYLVMTVMAGQNFGDARLVFVKLPKTEGLAAAMEKPVELQDYPAEK